MQVMLLLHCPSGTVWGGEYVCRRDWRRLAAVTDAPTRWMLHESQAHWGYASTEYEEPCNVLAARAAKHQPSIHSLPEGIDADWVARFFDSWHRYSAPPTDPSPLDLFQQTFTRRQR